VLEDADFAIGSKISVCGRSYNIQPIIIIIINYLKSFYGSLLDPFLGEVDIRCKPSLKVYFLSKGKSG